MTAHPHDCLVQPPPPEITLHLTLYYEPGEGCKHVCSRPNPQEDEEYVKDLACLGQRVDFLVTDGGDGDECHEKGIEVGPILDEMKSQGPDDENDTKERCPVF
jgi:hypothetical protein